MRLLFVRQNHPPERGPFNYTRDLAVDMAARGHTVTVVTSHPNYPVGKPYPGYGRLFPDIRFEDGVKVVRLPVIMASNKRPKLRVVSFITFAFSSFFWLIFAVKHDIVIASVPPATVGPIGLLLAKLRRMPIIMMLHDFEPLRSFRLRDKPKSFCYESIIRSFVWLYNRADKIVVPIESELLLLRDYDINIEKTEIITHGIDVDKFLKSANDQGCFKLPAKPGRKTFLYLGTFGLAHDLQSMLISFSKDGIRDFPFELLVIGDGECKSKCREILLTKNTGNIRLLPSIPQEQVASALCQADILLISQSRGLSAYGSKFYSCLAAGKPLLANCDGILKKAIESIGNGWVYDSNDDASLKGIMEAIFSLSDGELQRMGARGRDYARIHFDLKNRHNRWEELFCEVAVDGENKSDRRRPN